MKVFAVNIDVTRTTTYSLVVQAHDAAQAKEIAKEYLDFDEQWEEIISETNSMSEPSVVEGKFTPLGSDE